MRGPPLAPSAARRRPSSGCDDDRGHGALRLLEGPDEVGLAGRQAIRVGLVRRGEVVHLVVQDDACACPATLCAAALTVCAPWQGCKIDILRFSESMCVQQLHFAKDWNDIVERCAE